MSLLDHRSIMQDATEGPLQIDGATLEGGGQVIRTSLSLAFLQPSRPLRLHSIRAGRPKPGLANQHLVGARLAAALSGRALTGDDKGSTELVAAAHEERPLPPSLEAAAETAGAVTLMLQAALPPLLFCAPGRQLLLRGGTDVNFSPPAAHSALVLAPLLARMGVYLDARVAARGFNDGGPLGQVWRPPGASHCRAVATAALPLLRSHRRPQWPGHRRWPWSVSDHHNLGDNLGDNLGENLGESRRISANLGESRP